MTNPIAAAVWLHVQQVMLCYAMIAVLAMLCRHIAFEDGHHGAWVHHVLHRVDVHPIHGGAAGR